MGPHAKAHSVPDGSRKGALYVIDTMRNAPFGNVATTECAFPYSTDCRMRFSVECAFPHLRKRRPASRKSAFWPWALTENRTLAPAPHGRPHSVPEISRKGALCPRRLTEKRILRAYRHQRTCSVSPRRLPKTDAILAQRSVTLVRRDPARRGEASDHPPAVGRRTPTPHLYPTPSVPLPAPRKHQVLRLGLGCIKRTFRFGKWRVAFTPISLPCPTQQRGKTTNEFVEPRRKAKERRS